ncbi:FecR domain-containing protein [Herbaspirillum sp. alder98]|uniref:FecR domain-containing protein n=1 Tax=Herbaspirillum sp. alder98 TaxID=2913096 RepID=UPI001CD8401E|nr:FecR domain-containing protein [Herbaspirillum sp. alder98]MCA1324694.1 FecR domain-containing protein [Herbaspirillum sp. alder98]
MAHLHPGEVKADFDSLEQAAHWYAALHGGDESPEQRAAWSRWLHEKPEHRRAWSHIEAVSLRMAPLRAEGERDAAAVAIEVSAKRRHGRRQALRGLAVLGAGGLAGWLAWRTTPLHDVVMALNADHRTGTGQLHDFTLADGTRVWLNTGSAVDVAFDREHRLLRLRRGEILVDTGHEAQPRPFYVDTRFGRLQALGTRFTVRQDTDHVLLAVFDGRVLVRNLAGQEEVVPAGSQRRFSADSVGPEEPAERAREAWTRGVILAEDIRLDALLSEVRRYQLGHLGVDPRVADLRVVGRYPANDLQQTLTMLERDLPIRVQRVLPWWITLEPR